MNGQSGASREGGGRVGARRWPLCRHLPFFGPLRPRACVPLVPAATLQGTTDSVARVDTSAAGGGSGSAAASAMGDAAAAAMGGAGGTFSFVDLSISASGLIALDATSASDPLCVVFENTPRGLVEVGRTEIICTWATGTKKRGERREGGGLDAFVHFLHSVTEADPPWSGLAWPGPGLALLVLQFCGGVVLV